MPICFILLFYVRLFPPGYSICSTYLPREIGVGAAIGTVGSVAEYTAVPKPPSRIDSLYHGNKLLFYIHNLDVFFITMGRL